MDNDQKPTKTKQPENLEDLNDDVPTVDPDASLKIEEEETDEEEAPMEKSNKKLFVIGATVAGLIALAAVGFFLSQRKNISSSQSPIPTPLVATPSSTPTPKPDFNRAEWSLEVLNGTEVSGAAKKLADKLTALGYPVVKSGNADKQTYETTQLLIKKELQSKVDLVIADLKDVVKIASVDGQLKDSTASARIILGKE